VSEGVFPDRCSERVDMARNHDLQLIIGYDCFQEVAKLISMADMRRNPDFQLANRRTGRALPRRA
jgi:hypothetical protein